MADVLEIVVERGPAQGALSEETREAHRMLLLLRRIRELPLFTDHYGTQMRDISVIDAALFNGNPPPLNGR